MHFSLRAALLLMLVLTCATARAETVPAPRGWTESADGDHRILQRNRTTIRLGPWVYIGTVSPRDWLSSLEKSTPPGATFRSSNGVRPEKRSGGYSVTRTLEFGDSVGKSVLYLCPGLEQSARLLELHSEDGGFGGLLKGGLFIEKVCLKEPKAASSTPPEPPEEQPVMVVAEPLSNDDPGAKPDTVTIAQPAPPSGLKEIRGVIVMGIQSGGMFGITEDFIALFDDSTYTSDLGNTFAQGTEFSKRKKPSRWGQWRIQNSELELRKQGEDEFDTTRGNWVARAAAKNQSLTGCYGRLASSSGADYNSGTTFGVARTWCFWPNGRFTNSSTAFGSSTDGVSISMRSTSPKARGEYSIDGYTAVFRYDDGHEVRAAFCFANEDKDQIMLNGSRFMGRQGKF